MAEQQSNAPMFLMIWFALLMTVTGMIGVSAFLVHQQNGAIVWEFGEVDNMPLVAGLYVVAISLFAASRMIPSRMASQVDPQSIQHQTQLSGEIRAKLFVPYIIRIVLLETIAVFGMMLAILESDFMVGVPLFIFSLISILGAMPSDGLLKRMALSRANVVV